MPDGPEPVVQGLGLEPLVRHGRAGLGVRSQGIPSDC